LYLVGVSGDLFWYPPPASASLALFGGLPIDDGGWDAFEHLVCGGEGVIYAITAAHEIKWYRYDQATGWAPNSGNVIGGGWDFLHVVSGGVRDNKAFLYAVTRQGEVLVYQDALRDGSNGADGSRGWIGDRSSIIDQGGWVESGFSSFKHIVAGAAGRSLR
jgi:hypothetical protein